MFRKNKQENKAKLERKLYLARENPEPIFDLSECELNNVPPGVYSLCKVFLKEVLNLESNNLTSLTCGGQLKDLHLLKVLYIQNNAFKILPDDIYLLKSLIELNISNNKLKLLPENISKLENLEILDVSNNLLKSLPETLGNLTKLKRLNISGNSSIKYLPKSICKAQRLVMLELDIENLLYPPKVVAENGIESIMRYICNDIGYTYATPEIVEETVEVDSRQISYETDSFHARIWELEKIKQQKVQDFLDIEKYNETLQKREFELANSQKADRQKLLTAIAEDQKRLNSKLNELQVEKETDRFKLIEQLQEAEQNADLAINQLLSLSQKPMEQLLHQEKLEEERLLSAVNRYNETLRKDDILNAMQDILTQETEKFQQLDRYRQETSKTILQQELKSDTKLLEVLDDQDKYKNELILKLQKDSELQKALVGTLLERSDARSWSIMQQVRLVESQLASLTQIEIDRRKLQLDQHLSDFCQKRVDLSMLLMELLSQQKQRRAQLLSTLQSIEDERNDTIEDFWLKQYQRLLDNMPEGLSQAQNNIEPALSQALLMNGVIHCLPYLAKITQCFCDTSYITENDLIEAGIRDHNDRIHILDAFQVYEKERKWKCTDEERPSAPEMPLEEASAPLPDNIRSISSTECVICMDSDCTIIFVPCGHLCCCSKCSGDVHLCPLCRSDIQHKISLSC